MLSRNLEQTLHKALAIANEYRHEFATLEHLLLALTEDQDAMAVLRSCGISLPDLRDQLQQYIGSELTYLQPVKMSKKQNPQLLSSVCCNARPFMCNHPAARKLRAPMFW